MQAFLDTVLATRMGRDVSIPKGRIFHRAQRGIDQHEVRDDEGEVIGEETMGFSSERMKPRLNRATEGRANPAGIPVLYLASSEQTAISEVRPWIGSEISVAQFKLVREVRAIDLSRGHRRSPFMEITFEEMFGEAPIGAKRKTELVWLDIDNAFSRPTTLSDDAADYVPTQILAELFMAAGYDAIIYRSQFGEMGYNLALFDVEDAEPINCAPFEVTGISVEFKEIGNRWFSNKQYSEGPQSEPADKDSEKS